MLLFTPTLGSMASASWKQRRAWSASPQASKHVPRSFFAIARVFACSGTTCGNTRSMALMAAVGWSAARRKGRHHRSLNSERQGTGLRLPLR